MSSISCFKSEEIAEKCWKIENTFFGSTMRCYCYLVEGQDYTILIDTMLSGGSLPDFCRTLTEKPVKVVNTHAHWDHIGGNFAFDACYLHHREIPVFLDSVNYTKEQIFENAKRMVTEEYRELLKIDDFIDSKPMRIIPLYDGDEFDLGDRKIEVLEMPGHTTGSVVLIDHKTRLAFVGDACNGNTLLEFPHSSPVIVYLKSLLRLKEHQPEFDMMYGGHEITDTTIIDEAIETVAKVVAGTDARCERPGMFGTPVLYAAEKVKDGFERVDGKRFNMSYLPDNIFGEANPKHIIR